MSGKSNFPTYDLSTNLKLVLEQKHHYTYIVRSGCRKKTSKG